MPEIERNTPKGHSLKRAARASARTVGAKTGTGRINIKMALRESEERLHLAIAAGRVGAWDWDLTDDRLAWSDQVYEFFGIPRRDFDGRFATFARLIHPDDQERVGALIQQSLKELVPYVVELRIIRPTGELRWISARGKPMSDGKGKATRLIGACIDITDRKRAEELGKAQSKVLEMIARNEPLDQVLNTIAQSIETHNSQMKCAIFLLDSEARYFDRAFAPSLPPSFVEAVLTARHDAQKPAGGGGTAIRLDLKTARGAHDDPRWTEWLRQLAGDNQFVSCLAAPVEGPNGNCLGAFVMYRQVAAKDSREGRSELRLIAETATHVASIAIERMRAEEQLRKREERAQLLSDSRAQLLAAKDPGAVMKDVFPKVARHLGADIYYNFLVNEQGDALKLVSFAGITPDLEKHFRRVEFGHGICGTVAQTGQPIVANDIQNSTYDKANDARKIGVQTYACYPLIVEGRLLGTLSFASRTRTSYLEDELEFIRAVAQHTAVALDRQRTAEDLRRGEKRYREMISALPVACYTVDADGWLTFYNEAAVEIWGRKPELGKDRWCGAAGVRWLDGTPVDLADGPSARAIKHQKSFRGIEGYVVRTDGTRRRVLCNPDPLFDAAGNCVGAINVVLDVTEERENQAALERQKRSLEVINRVGQTLAGELDLEKLVQAVTDAGRELSGAAFGTFVYRARSEQGEPRLIHAVSGVPWEKVEDPGDTSFAAMFNNEYAVRIDDATKDPALAWLNSRDGQPYGHLKVRSYLAVPVKLRSKKITGGLFFGHPDPNVFTEETEIILTGIAAQAAVALDNAALYKEVRQSENALKQAQQELRKYTNELELRVRERTAKLQEAIEQMEEFSYTVSHDLRAPVRVINGYANALREDHSDGLSPEACNFLDRIIISGSRMDRLILDILTYTRLSQREFDLQSVSLDKLLSDILQQYPEIGSAKATIIVEPELGVVRGHEPSLSQAISNLLSNAVKFVVPHRPSRVRVWSEHREGRVRLWIEDNGIGIMPAHQRRLFGMFERVHPGESYEGTGIGLAIVRKAMERMGGKVGVESDGTLGSRFWIELPAASKDRDGSESSNAPVG